MSTDSNAKRAAYDLWFDESGRFMETSTRPEELDRSQGFASQLAGLLVPHGALTEGVAQSLLEQAHKAAGLQLGEEVHGMVIPQQSYDPLISRLLSELQARGFQPVRLVNLEGVRYGDRVTTYTQMVAELVLRVLRALSARGEPRVDLFLRGAVVVLGTRADGTPLFLRESEYDERIQKALAFMAVRRGVAVELAGWIVASVKLGSGKRWRELQVCDLISNASHSSFKRLGPETRKAFVEAFGSFDQTLVLRELFDRVDDLMLDRSYGRALMLLAESGINPLQLKDEGFRRRLATLVERLAALGARARDPELAALVTWLEQIIEHQRAVEEGRMIAAFLLREVDAPLSKRLDLGSSAGEIDWFTYALHRWTLTASNHLGDLVGARTAANQLDALTSSLAQRWEHASLLIQGLIAQAVHHTDCFAYDDVAARMKVVTTYYGELSGLFSTIMPNVFPAEIRSDARAAALGTWVQTETYAGLRDPKRLNVARELSDQAIAEFSTEDDKARQRQYRSHFEGLAGNFAEAREQLGRSLGLDVFTHDAIGKAIVAIGNSAAQGFALLHWLRLGHETLMVVGAEREAFLAAVKASKVFELSWFTGGHDGYPVHGILRRGAVVHAIQGSVQAAIGSLTHLRRSGRGMVLSTIVLAATVEVAALLWAKHRKDAELLLDNKEPSRLGALQQLQALGHTAKDGVPELWAVFEPWEAKIGAALKGGAPVADPRDGLLALARLVPY
ncbi:MAG: hypothetical protein ABJE95_16065 [Byssovorax sp.]